MRYLVAEEWKYRESMDQSERTVRFVMREGDESPYALQMRLEDGEWAGALAYFYGELYADVLSVGEVGEDIHDVIHGREPRRPFPGPVRVTHTLPEWARAERRARRENGI